MTPHPTHQLLDRLAAADPEMRVWLLTEPDDHPGWRPASAVVDADGALVVGLLDQLRHHHPTTDRVAPGAIWFANYCYPLMAVPIACFLSAKLVPDLDPHQVWVRFDEHGELAAVAWRSSRFAALADSPVARLPECTSVTSRDGLRDHLRESIVAHLHPLIDMLAAHKRLSRQMAWALAADYNASAFAWLGGLLLNDETHGAQEAIAFARPPSRLHRKHGYHRIEQWINQELAVSYLVDRIACCRYFKTEGGQHCGTCPHRPLSERLDLARKWQRERLTKTEAAS